MGYGFTEQFSTILIQLYDIKLNYRDILMLIKGTSHSFEDP